MESGTGCSICSEELVYSQEHSVKQCNYCGRTLESNVQCPNGHFVCDACHSSSSIGLIESYCGYTEADDPMKMAVYLMKNPAVKMHGPEHHFLVPAVLITAYYNATGQADQKKVKLAIARKRAELVLGGYCGTHGACGAAVGTGIFISVITGSTPLSKREWSLSNRITGSVLLDIANSGGPRCCKRDTFLAIRKSVRFIHDEFDVTLPESDVECDFYHRNRQCQFGECSYFPGQSTEN